jgi:hypothetical protein
VVARPALVAGVVGLLVGLVAGVVGLLAGLVAGLVVGLVDGLVDGLAVGLVAGLVASDAGAMDETPGPADRAAPAPCRPVDAAASRVGLAAPGDAAGDGIRLSGEVVGDGTGPAEGTAVGTGATRAAGW